MSQPQNFWSAWKTYGEFLANLVPRVLIFLFYFSVFVPFALGVKLFTDPLSLKPTSNRFWHTRPTGDKTLTDTLKQY